MTKLPASGFQIAFLIVAVLLLTAPADKYLFAQWQWAREAGFPISRLMIFAVAAAILSLVPALRRHCKALLAVPVPQTKRLEILFVVGIHVVAGCAAFGATALWIWSLGGEPALARRMGEELGAAQQWSRAFSLHDVMTFLVIGGLVAPIIEELVFRGMLYPAFESRWGWVASAILTSALFAALHANKISQFLGSLLYVCLLRRTGSLRASIIAHGSFNILMWYPLAGRFVFPAGRETGEISVWWPQLTCLLVTFFAVPIYMWMSRTPPQHS
jgi:uncharacterized protein